MSGASIVRVTWCAIALLGLAATGCAQRSDALGAGDKINWCVSYFIMDSFQEPLPDSRSEVQQYAEASIRVIDRVDERFELSAREELELPNGRMPKVDPSATADHAVMRAAFARLRDRVKEVPRDGQGVRDAVNEFTDDAEYRAAERRVTDYFIATCAR